MQLYHHPYSVDSQKVRLALEEKGIDYTSYHANPLTGKNLDSSFFRTNPSGKLPVFQNGSRVIYQTADIMRQPRRLRERRRRRRRVAEWVEKIDGWDSKIFTLAHVPQKYRLFVSRFIRRVIIARMSESPDLASEKLKDPDIVKQSEEKLSAILDDAEAQLGRTPFLVGEEYTIADSMFVPVLARIALLNLEREYINGKPRIAEYYERAKRRPSYRAVIGKYFSGWRRYRTLFKTLCCLGVRDALRRY
ncbi:unnamed protein product [Spirodela intermedia]|uniref:Uncharacterized protein n=1 Tax=Spirodela intermedia TaxID=51605 RepID=A0A7I8ITF6_SPIIN|nr:unnamed protein product [Spirodela intermedia]CAA6660405.1 unnamed protein product [Spirodela intermedia]